jgi:ABC-2 type transport system permease protein
VSTSSSTAGATRAASRGPAPTLVQSTMLVTGREVRMRLRSKSFLISTAILLLGILASIVVTGFLAANDSDGDRTRVAVVGAAQQAVSASESLEGVPADSVEDARAMVRDGDVDAAVVPDERAAAEGRVVVIGDDSAPDDVVSALTETPRVELLQESATNPAIAYIVALAFGLVFFMSALTFGMIIAQSVVEEKQTRVVELLMSTIPVRALLAGKVLGNSILAFAQIALIALMAGLGLLVTGQTELFAVVGPAVLWFVVFFLFGFVLLASLFAATAALVSRQEDVGAVTAPVTYLVMIPYLAVIFFNDNPVVLAVMSYVPFAAPVGMPMRLFLGSAEWWEPVVSLLVLLVTTAAVVVLGSRIYSNSLLRTGSRVKLREALKG